MGVSAFLIAVGLLLSHLLAGADIASTAAPFVLSTCVLLALLCILEQARNVTIAMAVASGLFFLWLALEWFGPWHLARHEVQTLIAAGAITSIGFTIGRTKRGLKLAWNTLIWSMLAFVAIAGFSFFSAPPSSETFGSRLSAGFGSPNTAATLFGLILLVSSAKLMLRFQSAHFNARPRGDRVALLAQYEFVTIALVLGSLICLVFTVSRAGISIGLFSFFALIAFEVFRMRSRGHFSFLRKRRAIILLLVPLVAILALAVTGEINQSSQESLLENASGRQSINQIYWNVFLEKPWLGHGLGSFNALNDQITTADNAATLMPLGAAHNVILQWLVQQGIVGVLAMTFIFGIIFFPIISALRSRSKKPRNFLRLAVAATFLVFAHGMVDYALEIPSVMWTYAYILGLAAGYASMIRVQPQQSDE
jgi:O-antigen ligase